MLSAARARRPYTKAVIYARAQYICPYYLVSIMASTTGQEDNFILASSDEDEVMTSSGEDEDLLVRKRMST